MKKIFILLLSILVLASCNAPKNNDANVQEIENNNVPASVVETIDVVTSIIPLASITNFIGGEYVQAQSLVPTWVSPHAFDIKPTDVVSIEESDFVVYLWLDHIDGFLDKAIQDKANVLSVSTWIELLESEWHDHHDHGDDHSEEEHHDEGDHHDDHDNAQEDEHKEEENHALDPHIWWSGKNALVIAKSILDSLITLSPENQEYFEQNFATFQNEIEVLKEDFMENIKGKTQNDFIVFHDAHNYLLEELNINAEKKHVFRTSVLNDPNSSEMKNLIDEINEKSINVAFTEPQLDSTTLDRLASEYQLNTYILNPIWIDDGANGYIENYKNNLESLEKIYE